MTWHTTTPDYRSYVSVEIGLLVIVDVTAHQKYWNTFTVPAWTVSENNVERSFLELLTSVSQHIENLECA